MRNRKTDWIKPAAAMSAIAAVSLGAMIAGCAEEPPPPPPPKKAPPPPPPPPDPMEGVSLNDKVQFPDELVPSSPEAAKAIAEIANAFASGNDESLRTAIVESDHGILDALIAGGLWGENTDAIEGVRICSLEDDGGTTRLGLGVQDDRGAYLLGWETDSGRDYKWQSLDIELQTASRVSELDGASLLPRHIAEAKQFLVVVEEVEKDKKSNRRSGGGTTSDPGNAPDRSPGFKKPKRRFR